MLGVIIVGILLAALNVAYGKEESIEAFLTYEDQLRDDLPSENTIILKRKLFPTNDVRFEEFTFCLRLQVLAYNGKNIFSKLWLPNHKGWSTFQIRDPTTLGDIFSFPTWDRNEFPKKTTELLNGGALYVMWPIWKEDLNAREWHHFCFGISVPQRKFVIVHNGYTQANHTQPPIWTELDQYINGSLIFQPYNGKQGMRLTTSGRDYFSGFLTDIHFWKRMLNKDEMYAFTTCQEFPPGDILPWSASDWEVYNKTIPYKFRVVEVLKSKLCPSQKKYTWFPDGNTATESYKLCEKFGGKVANMSNKQQVGQVIGFFKKLREHPDWAGGENAGASSGSWTRYRDERVTNRFEDFETGDLPHDPLNWSPGEPNGGEVENCAEIGERDKFGIWGKVNDLTCDDLKPILCEHIQARIFNIRGLCKETIFDTRFSMRSIPNNNKRYFSGLFGWDIAWDTKEHAWIMSNTKLNNTFAKHSEAPTYPLGRNKWQIINDNKCSYKNNEATLNFSPCNQNEYTCESGICILMEQRCNQRQDCGDNSDEQHCKTVHIDQKKYIKSKPPPPYDDTPFVHVHVQIHFLEVLEIEEVSKLFRAKYILYIEWLDPRITFYNLKTEQKLNGLTPTEMDQIWIPSLTFLNTDDNEITVNDEKSGATVMRKGNFTRSSPELIENIFIFDGSENPIIMNRVYETSWICNYAMQWYPFDTQKCSLTFTTTGELGEFVDFIVDGHQYLGPKELTQYFIRDSQIGLVNNTISGYSAVQLQITLGRRLLGNILTVFLPTLLLNIMGHAANYFKSFFFEASVTVNLTVMLVLTTMFVSVANQLPKTSYIKMIDVWLLFNLIIPFVEVLLHTYKDTLRIEDEINHHGKAIDVSGENKVDQPDRVSIVGWAETEDERRDSDEMKKLKKNLVSTKENVQDRALSDYYSLLKVKNEKRLKTLDFFGHVIIPCTAVSFMFTFWGLGIIKYNFPVLLDT